MISRLLAHVAIIPGGCWLWTASTKNGYGQINLGRRGRDRIRYAHRLMWLLVRGRIPRGLCVLHACDTRTCVRPRHLFLGTKRTNSQDMVAKGRLRGGWRNCHGPALEEKAH